MMSLTPRRPRRRKIEHGIQVALFDWRAMMVAQIPELALLHAIPNGAALKHSVRRTASGKNVRYSAEGKALRKEGLTSSIPDVHWPVPRGRYHGLYIEHKAPKKSVPADQRKMHDLLRAQGHYVVVSRDAQVSIDLVRAYWGLGPFTTKENSTCAENPQI